MLRACSCCAVSQHSGGLALGQHKEEEFKKVDEALCCMGVPVPAWGWGLRSARVCAPQLTTPYSLCFLWCDACTVIFQRVGCWFVSD